MMKRKIGGMGRRGVLRLMAGGAAACLADAMWIEPGWLGVTRREIRMPSWPAAFDGLRAGVAADLHYRGGKHDHEMLDALIRRANAERLDLMCMPGDFINSDARLVAPLAEILSDLRAEYGVFASMGNHDGWNAETRMVRREFARHGIRLLVNENALVSVKGRTLAVAGSDSVWAGNPEPGEMLRGLAGDTPVVALVHEPDYFDEMKREREWPGLLQVSGHTHGGQCRVPIIGYAPILPHYGRKYPYGLYESGNPRLFVTRGVGTTGFRIRFSCAPELVVLTLRCG